MAESNKSLTRFKAFLRHLGKVLDADLSVEVWDGEVVPLCRQPTGPLALRVADSSVITRLLRSPKMMTVVSLFASGRLRIANGTLLDLEPKRADIETKIRAGAWRKIDKRLALSALAPFLLARAKDISPDHAFSGDSRESVARGRDDKALVQFHYDLSNDFYALFLDPAMVYSCAYFPTWDTPLEDAQRAKLDMICRKLRLKPGERFLDIGCGWGGLVIHAAQHYGVEAHGCTLSQAQFDFATARIAELGLAERVSIELVDFRKLSGTYDKIASVGMFEHVGEANLDGYFAKIFELLPVRGLYLHHAITRRSRRDRRYARAPMTQAMINYIFPGGYLDPIGNTIAGLERREFDVCDVENLREHYALTCRHWTERLYARRSEAEAMIGEARAHLWLLYLARSSISFERGAMAIFQTVASKRAPGRSGLPPTRADLYSARPPLPGAV